MKKNDNSWKYLYFKPAVEEEEEQAATRQSVAVLLAQAVRASDDGKVASVVGQTTDPAIIENTVRTLPTDAVLPLMTVFGRLLRLRGRNSESEFNLIYFWKINKIKKKLIWKKNKIC